MSSEKTPEAQIQQEISKGLAGDKSGNDSSGGGNGGKGSSEGGDSGGKGSSEEGDNGGKGSSEGGDSGGKGSPEEGDNGGKGSSEEGDNGGKGSSEEGDNGGKGSSEGGDNGGKGSSEGGDNGEIGRAELEKDLKERRELQTTFTRGIVATQKQYYYCRWAFIPFMIFVPWVLFGGVWMIFMSEPTTCPIMGMREDSEFWTIKNIFVSGSFVTLVTFYITLAKGLFSDKVKDKSLTERANAAALAAAKAVSGE